MIRFLSIFRVITLLPELVNAKHSRETQDMVVERPISMETRTMVSPDIEKSAFLGVLTK